MSTDRTQLVTITESKENVIENLNTQVFKLTRHSYTAKCQSEYMKKLKTSDTNGRNRSSGRLCAENYSNVVQDEIQSFHWENKQASLHPFVAYQRQEDNTLQHRNICVISYCKDHTSYDSNCFCISEGCPKIFEDRASSC